MSMDKKLTSAVYAAVEKAYDHRCDIEDAADEILEIIKADRKRHDRMLAHEWIRPALRLEEDAPYRFDFYAQEIEKLRNDSDYRKRRGEPVAWMYEDEIPDNYPYDAMFPYSKVEGVRMFPVYAPQPA